jgi:hypothetical protein
MSFVFLIGLVLSQFCSEWVWLSYPMSRLVSSHYVMLCMLLGNYLFLNNVSLENCQGL